MPRQVAPNRDIGPACIVLDPTGINLDLRPTFGTVSYTSEVQFEDVMHDEHGVQPVDAMITGRLTSLTVPMTSPNLLTLQATIPSSTAHKVGGKYHTLKVPNAVGALMFASAVEIILKPVQDQVCSADVNEWVHIWRCFPIDQHDIGYDLTGQRVFSVLFKTFSDDSSGNVNQVYRYGPAPS